MVNIPSFLYGWAWQVEARPGPQIREAWIPQVTLNVEGTCLQGQALLGCMWVLALDMHICSPVGVRVNQASMSDSMHGLWWMAACGILEGHTPSRSGAASGIWWSCCSQPPAPTPLGCQGGKTAGKGHMHSCTHVYNSEGQESATLT